jgi:hypothetical protein
MAVPRRVTQISLDLAPPPDRPNRLRRQGGSDECELMLIAVVMTSLAACNSWNDGPFGYRAPDGDRGIGADNIHDDHQEKAPHVQNEEALRRQTPLTSQ